MKQILKPKPDRSDKMKKEYLVNTYNAICVTQQLTGTTFEFKRFINHYKKCIKKCGEEILDDLELWQEDNQSLALEYALKDDKGNVVYNEIAGSSSKRPKGLLPGENEAYDMAKKEHKARHDEILDGEIEIDCEDMKFLWLTKSDVEMMLKRFE